MIYVLNYIQDKDDICHRPQTGFPHCEHSKHFLLMGFPIYLNINNYNVIYTLDTHEKAKKPEPINVIILAETFQDMLESGMVNNKSKLAKYTGYPGYE